MTEPVLRLILGDQLSLNLATLRDADPDRDLILMCELHTEATYVAHHRKKLVLVFSAMRHFARALKSKGFRVRYRKLDDTDSVTCFVEEMEQILEASGCRRCVITQPGEFRLLQQFTQWQQECAYQVELREDDRFLSTPAAFEQWAKGRKQLRMEYFYRLLRREHNVLMQNGKPIGEQWNFDSSNRKALPADRIPPSPTRFEPDDITRDVIQMVSQRYDHFGDLDDFHYAVTREQALQVLSEFIRDRLPNFGDYQDAMRQGDPWLYHSHLSFYLNLGLLDPAETLAAAEKAFHDGQAPLNAVEGFIRQILGWREYVRGLYWLQMPDYAESNFLDAQRPLPALYWGAETALNCLSQCVDDTRRHAYAHHIQRLMVLGNFALLTGIEPKAVNEWYLLVYADAYEWVEMPNVQGMVLFADGGLMASKPYIASGAYIHRMSDYCTRCRFDVKQKTGPRACPFNYLYWDFLDRHRDKLASNPRLGLAYRNLDRMSAEALEATRESARIFLQELE
ncbi:cryptochrome/photolyase family protein [Marinobacterium sp. AK62]|uniref:Cryptochrome/photolyase family protein n=1 Tax=Marinobacterium alkalitolerans TaxID=1542925 RepID=A0ABS3ZFN9_9GAMM|nr:cryptochrome/photolyase family protein [Marinobacterium alkalitolerans]MBP0049859.1 cryptochrome/photolyase family protein [Marinobacterium alkalitolerans]